MFGKFFVKKPQGSLPDFLIVGAPKCGTTSLFEYLCGHPDVARPARKEIHYFDENYARGLRWYRAHFPIAGPTHITGEATTAYLFAKDAPARAAALVPDAKIIAVLRDPVRRVISHYWHNQRRGRVRVSFESYFEEALSPNQDRETNQARQFIRYPVQWGFYKEQIERWFDCFPPEQFRFLRFEDLIADTQNQTRAAFEFLGLPDAAIDTGKIFNASPSYPVEASAITDRLAEVYRKRNAGLEKLIGARFTWDAPVPSCGHAPVLGGMSAAAAPA
ncbi:MAG TPA: sulfotransferase domain-containing protein [Rhizomicrobium sp.]|nr:sulfotransferase domain-containing protein [Rhizomicrobium sp.]